MISTNEDSVMKKGRSKNEPLRKCVVTAQERLTNKTKWPNVIISDIKECPMGRDNDASLAFLMD